ncbi:MAG: hypothetical protein V4601_10110 [Pseudomonadota bacterium]
MSLFTKKEDHHAGSGIDKPAPKGIVEKVVEKVKSVGQAGAPPVPPEPASGPAKTPAPR